MSTFDTVVLLLLGASLIYSFFKGMVREIFSLMAYAFGYFLALKFHETLAVHVSGFVANKLLAGIISFGLIFMTTSIAIKLMGKWVQNLMHSAGGISGFDKVMGGALGVLKGLFIVGIVMIPLEFFPDIDKKVSSGSVLAPYLKQVSSLLRQNMFSVEALEKKPADVKSEDKKELPSSVKDVKEKLSILKKFQNLPQGIKDKVGGLISSNGPPQDEHPEKSKKELEKLLRSKLKDP
ncbi:MAG: CvpA family protein [Nitrospinales bacterium]